MAGIRTYWGWTLISSEKMQWWKKLSFNRQRRGQEGEALALQYLRAQGLTHVVSNFRRPFGEIDLIMQDRATLVFVEVRSRAKGRFGGAAASVTSAKQRRLVLAARAYLQRYSITMPCRFDVVAIDDGEIDWLKDVIAS
jgi:putative endonuclease